MLWQTQRFQIDLSSPKIMGIVNVTPDSFSDGGQYSGSLKTALAHAEKIAFGRCRHFGHRWRIHAPQCFACFA